MDIDQKTAAALCFPKPQYRSIERERRWLCREVPVERIVQTVVIEDLYVTGTQLRLREERPVNGGAAMLRLTRKADVSKFIRLVTSIYLPEEEFAVLATSLKGIRIKKIRHRLSPSPGVTICVDEFQADLAGLVLAEAEFETIDLLAAFPMPDYALREVTDDLRFTGGGLTTYGLPAESLGSGNH